jgi:glyoxylase I family protein
MLGTSQLESVAIVFTVKDLKRTETFYREVLDIPLERQEGDFLQVKLPSGVELLFFEGESKIGSSPQIVFGLGKGGIDSVVDAFAAKGATIVTPVTEAPGGWSVEFLDPDSHPLALFQDGGLPRRL